MADHEIGIDAIETVHPYTSNEYERMGRGERKVNGRRE